MVAPCKFTVFVWCSALVVTTIQPDGEWTALALSNVGQHQFDNDFEDGSVAPWVDLSEGGTRWAIKTSSSDSWRNEKNQILLPPPPLNGKNFLHLEQDLNTFDFGTFSTTNFIALPGDKIQFSYFISSTWSQFNNLQIFWSEVIGQRMDERFIAELYTTSISGNIEWRTSTVMIPVSRPAEGKIIFNGFSSPFDENSLIAIDDIKFIPIPPPISSTERYSSATYSYYETSVSLVTVELATENVKSSECTKVQKTLETSSYFNTATSGTTTDNNNKCVNSSEIPEGTDFSPCSCYWYAPGEPYVPCNLANMTEVRDGLFSRLNHIFIGFLELTIMDGDFIPSIFLDSAVRSINYLFIDCIYMKNPLRIHEEAFKNKDNNITEFVHIEFRNCNLSSLNFFSGMKHIENVLFKNSSNLYEVFSTIPGDFGMDVLRITKCSNLFLIDNYSKLPGDLSMGLLEFRVFENEQVSDQTVDVMLEWLLSTESKDSLKKLHLYDNGLTKIPTQLWRFTKLQYFSFDKNKLMTGIVEKGAFKFSYLLFAIWIGDCGIHTIQPDAYQGDYSSAEIDLQGNNLTRFESDVFKPILVQMDPTVGMAVGGNSFDCISDPCHLSWLLRDRADLKYLIFDAFCEDGRSFDSISPDDDMFQGCP